MGQNSNNPFKEGGELMADYLVTNKKPELFLTFLTHKKTKKEFLLRQQTFNDLRESSLNSQKIKKRSIINNNHLTNLISNSMLISEEQERTEDHMCSNFYKVYTLWDYPSKSLEEETSQRAVEKNKFQSKQIWSILTGSIIGLASLQEREIKHECLTLKTIRMEEDGNIKVVDPLALALQTNIDCVHNNRNTKHVYLSPQQCESIETQKPIINKNSYKNDVFTLGMIILQCGLLERQDKCYQNECSSVNFQRVQANLQRFGRIYEEPLRKMVEIMLNRDIRYRPDWLDLNQHVNTNSKSSRNTVTTNKDQKIAQQPKRQQFISRVLAKEGEGRGANGKSSLNKAINQQQKPSQFYGHPVNQNDAPMSVTTYLPQKIGTKVAGPAPNSSAPSQTFINNIVQNPPFQAYRPQEQGVRVGQSYNNNISQPVFPFISLLNNIPTGQPLVYQPIQNTQIQSLPRQPPNESVFYPPAPTQNLSGYYRDIEPMSYKPDIQSKASVSSNFQSFDQRPIVYAENSPLNINQLIKPTYSVNYQVKNKGISPDRKQANTYPFDPKLTKTPEIVDNSELQMHPTFVQQHFKMGSRYQGYKLNGKRHGRGKFFYQDGGRYDGEWKENKMQGYGKLFYQSNKPAYQGYWVNDMFQGKGRLYNQNPTPLKQAFDYYNFDQIDEYWEYYQGDFCDDLKNGNGILKFSNGQTFQGTFKQDMIEGEGTFYTRDGKRIRGIWRQNHLEQILAE